MQIIGMLIFLVIWLCILWVGSLNLEATGMERTKARFQALSALTGTGFTTREAENIVNHPKRRKIVTWLIFLGNLGIVTFILILILYLRSGLKAPTLPHIIILLISIVIIGLIAWLGVIGKISDAIIKMLRKGHPLPVLLPEETLYQAGDFGVIRVSLNEKASGTRLKVGDPGLKERNMVILAIERGNQVISLPGNDEELAAGDGILCYGKVPEITGLLNK